MEPLVTNKSEGGLSIECDVMQVSSDEDSSDISANLPPTNQSNKMTTEDVTEKLDGMGSLKLASPPHHQRLNLPPPEPRQEEKPVDTQGKALVLENGDADH